MMRAGELDRSIIIQSATETRDSYGDVLPSWTTFATVWATVTANRGDERFAAYQVVAQADILFRIRWRSGITVKMRISYDGQIYDIVHIAEIGRREGLDILARLITT